VTKRVETVKRFEARLDRLRAGKLTPDEAIDAEVLAGLMKAELLDLDGVRTWRNNPIGYIATPPGAVDGLMKRDYAPAATRLRSVVAQLKATRAMFAALRANVDNPPKEFADLASARLYTMSFFSPPPHFSNAATASAYQTASSRPCCLQNSSTLFK
jgi:hypothetical protein